MPDLGKIEDLFGKGVGTASPTTQQQLQKRMNMIRLDQLEKATQERAASLGVPYINLKGFPVSPDALRLVPQPQAEALKAIPFLLHGDQIRIAALDPAADAVKELAFQLGERNRAHVEVYLTSQQSLDQAMQLYATLPIVKQQKGGVEITEEDLNKYRARIKTTGDVAALVNDENVTDLVAMILAAALQVDSSDVHIEAEQDGIALRYRVDGMLTDVATLRKDRWKPLISRIKLVAGLKLNIVDRPQDGRFTIFVDQQQVDVRTSTLPTAFGESVVMRLLVPKSIGLAFEQLGFRPAASKKLEAEMVKPNGMIVTTGPTGSGKTTTLYAILKRLNTPDVKIITLEDPVEYKLEGINQSQIDHTKEYTFSKGLRSVLRQDPDIVMVGEIRDRETAETAIQAALTGHLLLSTLHTNDAAGAVPRFLSMGVDAALLAPALRIIMAQRLVRKLCLKCKKPHVLSTEERQRVTAIMAEMPANSGEMFDVARATFFEANPSGCEACTGGYKGRVGVYEVLVVNPQVEERIRGGSVSDASMRVIAREQGMVTMEQDGLLKAADGDTSLDEVFRVAAS